MSKSVNKAFLLGNLGRDPELRTTPSGKSVCNFSLATTARVGGEDKTEWHRIVCWQQTADFVGQYLHKGDQVFVEGRLETRNWEDKDGGKRQTTEIIAWDVVATRSSSQREDSRAERRDSRREQPNQGWNNYDDDGNGTPEDGDLPF